MSIKMLIIDHKRAEKRRKKNPMSRLDHQECATKTPAARPDGAPRWKRVLDVTLVLVALPLVLPVMICVALLIWIVSEGPVLFRQERIGYLGRRFNLLQNFAPWRLARTPLSTRAIEQLDQFRCSDGKNGPQGRFTHHSSWRASARLRA